MPRADAYLSICGDGGVGKEGVSLDSSFLGECWVVPFEQDKVHIQGKGMEEIYCGRVWGPIEVVSFPSMQH